MSRHHFLGSTGSDGRIVLRGSEGHHAARVRRVRVGEAVSIGNGEGTIWHADVASVDGDVVTCEVTGHVRTGRPRPRVTVVQAVAKQDATEEAIARGVELGVDRFSCFLAARTVVRWDAAKREKARQRFDEIALGAMKQSHSPWRTEITEVQASLEAALAPGFVLALHPDASAGMHDALPELPPDELALVVGPEGGLDDAELALLAARGASIVTLGPRVLRAQTAGGAVAFFLRQWYDARTVPPGSATFRAP